MPRWILVLASTLLLAGCGTTTTLRGDFPADTAVNTYSLQGRFAFQGGGEAASGRITWTRSAHDERVLLQDPFGGGIGELLQNRDGAQLTLADGRRYSATDGETLLAGITGVQIPMGALGRWLTGQGAAADSAMLVRDDTGRALAFRHDGWQVEYRYSDGVQLPAGIRARREDGTQLRLSIDQWDLRP